MNSRNCFTRVCVFVYESSHLYMAEVSVRRFVCPSTTCFFLTQNMTRMILRMTQVTSFMVKMTFKRMRYRPTDRPTNGPTDGPTEWDIESLHAAENMMWGMKQEC